MLAKNRWFPFLPTFPYILSQNPIHSGTWICTLKALSDRFLFYSNCNENSPFMERFEKRVVFWDTLLDLWWSPSFTGRCSPLIRCVKMTRAQLQNRFSSILNVLCSKMLFSSFIWLYQKCLYRESLNFFLLNLAVLTAYLIDNSCASNFVYLHTIPL